MERSFLEQISEILLEHQQTVAVAESVTAGYLQFLLSNLPQASSILEGGITAYNCAQKTRHLGVEPIYALPRFGVGADISKRMAMEVTSLFSASVGIGITGFADRFSDQDQGAVAFLSIVYLGKEVLAAQLNSVAPDFSSRQIDFAEQTIELLAETLAVVLL